MKIDLDLFSQIANDIKNSLTKTHALGLHMKIFTCDNDKVLAIEQNPNKTSEWAALARDGKHVVQFKLLSNNQYLAVSVDGKVHEY